MAFMSYYLLEGTANELANCVAMIDNCVDEQRKLDNRDDERNAQRLYEYCRDYIEAYEDYNGMDAE